MIPILTTEQVRACDTFTIENEPIASIDLMERACEAFCELFVTRFPQDLSVTVVCGPGNNGGDGMGIARLLREQGFHVDVYLIESSKYSEDLQINLERYEKTGEIRILKTGDTPEFDSDIIIDAIFGSGITRPPGGFYQAVIESINDGDCAVVSVDMPSGLMADAPSEGTIINADLTITFQVPKLGLFLPENGPFAREWEVVDIGLLPEAIEQHEPDNFLITDEDASIAWPVREKFDHKGSYGHCLIIGGSKGKMGAPILAGSAALRTGAGLVTLGIPSKGLRIAQTALPEAMALVIDEPEEEDFERFTACAVGTGLGTSQASVQLIQSLLHDCPPFLVLDADALNVISENREFLAMLPKSAVLTPHPGEFRRLVGDWNNDFEKLELLKEFSKKYGVITALKGAHTVVCSAKGELYFNATGNPGMATGGSGDVLTGIIVAMLAQMGDPLLSCILSVYIHGLAGDLAAEELGEEGLISSDIIEFLPYAIQAVKYQ